MCFFDTCREDTVCVMSPPTHTSTPHQQTAASTFYPLNYHEKLNGSRRRKLFVITTLLKRIFSSVLNPLFEIWLKGVAIVTAVSTKWPKINHCPWSRNTSQIINCCREHTSAVVDLIILNSTLTLFYFFVCFCLIMDQWKLKRKWRNENAPKKTIQKTSSISIWFNCTGKMKSAKRCRFC